MPLAHEFIEDEADEAKPVYEVISAEVLRAARLPYVLCVGTREIRKNNLGLAKVWQRLERKGVALPRLVFAGQKGWLNDEFDQFMQRTNNLDNLVQIVDGPSQQELAYLYRNCLFTVFPSFCEGWGLPIGESLWFGRPAIVSNTTAMPEVAGDHVDYIDPFDLASLEAAVERMLDSGYRRAQEEQIRSMRLRTWGDYAADLLEALRKINAR